MQKPENSEPPQKAELSDRIVAVLFGGLIGVWLIVYVIFAVRSWLGKA